MPNVLPVAMYCKIVHISTLGSVFLHHFERILFMFSIHPPPAFGSSTNLEALALEASKSQGQDHDSTSDNFRSFYR
jgi:hypothetical protein